MKSIIFFLSFLMLSKITNQQMLGGFSDADSDDCNKSLLSFLQQYGYGTTLFFDYKIESCKKQVVAGMNYTMSLNINGQKCDVTLFRSLPPVKITLSDRAPNTCFSI